MTLTTKSAKSLVPGGLLLAVGATSAALVALGLWGWLR